LLYASRHAEFDKVLRILQKSSLTALPGTTVYLPPQFITALIALPDDVEQALKLEKSAAKKSSQANAKALNGMKQKVKKVRKENEEMVALYQKVRLLFSLPTRAWDRHDELIMYTCVSLMHLGP
jgi:hypothetical protein